MHAELCILKLVMKWRFEWFRARSTTY